jgi:hypothetical protein
VGVWPGTVWIVGAICYLLTVPLLLGRLRNARAAEAAAT